MAEHDGKPAPVTAEVLEAVNAAMVALHVRYHGREPATSRTRMMGEDMLACLLGDVYTDVEKTMIELQRQGVVHETRSTFQQAMEHRFVADVERLTGRRVVRFISTHHVPTSSSRSPARILTSTSHAARITCADGGRSYRGHRQRYVTSDPLESPAIEESPDVTTVPAARRARLLRTGA